MKSGVTTYERFGSWYYRFWHTASRPRSPYQQGGYRTQRKASDAGWAKRRTVERGYDAGDDLTLADYAARWLTERAADLEPSTLASYRERLEGHVLPALGRLRLTALTPGHVRRFLGTQRPVYARNGVRLMRAALSSLCSSAVGDGLIPANPCLGLRLRGPGAARTQPIRPFTLAERGAFLTAARRDRHARLFELLVRAGLRPSEAYALRGEDVDRAGGRVHVARAWVKGRLKPTKTSQARWVDVPDALVAQLPTDPGLLFTAPAGAPLDPSKVAKAYRRCLKAAKLGHRRLYDLRHTYACLRLAAGAPPTYVAAQLGHATPATTFRFYARWIPAAGRQWVEAEPGIVRATVRATRTVTARK